MFSYQVGGLSVEQVSTLNLYHFGKMILNVLDILNSNSDWSEGFDVNISFCGLIGWLFFFF